MDLDETLIWTIRIIIVSIGLGFIAILGASSGSQITDTSMIRFEQTFYTVSQEIIENGQLQTTAFHQGHFDDFFANQLTRMGFVLEVTLPSGETLRTYYDEEYYYTRRAMGLHQNYQFVTGRIPAYHEDEQLWITYEFIIR